MRRLPRVLGFVVLGLVVLVMLVAAGVYLNAQRRLGEHFDNPVPDVKVAGTPEQVERGKYLVAAFPGCAGCHARNPAASPPVLDGNYIADLKPLGEFYAPNLTPGGPLKDWSDGEIVRAIREGVDKSGRGLLVMPSEEYQHLSDDDVQAVVAYLRSQPAVQHDQPPISPSPLGIVLMGTGQVSTSRQPPVRGVAGPPRGATAAYGKYLIDTSGCTTCHGANLDGQNIPQGPPPGPNLRIVKGWTQEQFLRALREGVDPSDHHLADTMPWRQYGRGTDDDLKAIYEHLRSMP
ncbi:MAG TPA: c-type cytochrome [Chloroflexota bacterium]|nr:c-type cytochrome [Chloroflexota bacterium]